MNPFKYGCVVSGENFCRRPELQRQLSELLKSGQNVVMHGARRMGKTSVVCETAKSMRGWKLVYVDLFGVRSGADFCRRTVSAVAKCGGSRFFLEKTVSLLGSLRPVFSMDRDTGSPTISVDVKASRSVESAEEVLDMIAAHAKSAKLCVVFDEFQDILDVADHDVLLASLRAKIQFLPDVPFVFLGSVRNRMHAIFDSPKSPFFKSAISFGIGPVDNDDMVRFITERFRVGSRSIGRTAAEKILRLADNISGDIQELCETTWLSTASGSEISERDVDRGLEAVFARESRAFSESLGRLTAVQKSVLRGLAEPDHPKVFSGGFMETNGVKNASSVSKALKRLIGDEILYEFGGEYRFENPFFREWMLRQP